MSNQNNNHDKNANTIVTNAVLVRDPQPITVSVPVSVPVSDNNSNANIYSIRGAVSNNELTNNMLKTYNLAKSVKIFSLIDIFFSFLYSLYNFYMLIPLIFSYAGYHGSKKYEVNYINLYLCYQMVNLILRTISFIILVSNTPGLDYFFTYLFFTLSTIIGMWVLKITMKLSKAIITLSGEELNVLRTLKIVPNSSRIIYY